jgi:hypothetical protein
VAQSCQKILIYSICIIKKANKPGTKALGNIRSTSPSHAKARAIRNVEKMAFYLVDFDNHNINKGKSRGLVKYRMGKFSDGKIKKNNSRIDTIPKSISILWA